MHAHAEFPACISRPRDGKCGDGAQKLCFVVFLGSATRRVAEAVLRLVLLDVCEKSVSRSRVEIWIGRYCENGPFTSHSSASVCLGEEEHTKPRTCRFFFPNDCLPGSASQAHSSHDHDPYPISFPHSPIPQYFRRIYPSILGTVRVWHREDIVARTLALVSARCDRLPASCFVGRPPS